MVKIAPLSLPLLKVENLTIESLKFEAPRILLDHVGFEIYPQEIVGLIGESGAGKTLTALTLMNLLPRQYYRILNGAIWFYDQNILTLSRQQLRDIRGKKISFIFQDPGASFNPLQKIQTQLEELLIIHNDLSEKQRFAKIKEAVKQVQLPISVLNQYPHQLSGGELQRVMIAMAVLNEPELIIADEPTTALDIVVQKKILDLLLALHQKKGISILLISHDLDVVKKYTDRLYVMKEGKVIETQITRDFFRKDDLEDARVPQKKRDIAHGKKHSVTTPALLSVQDCSVLRYKDHFWETLVEKEKGIARDITLEIYPGETVGLIGETGAGKTSLAQAILGMRPYMGVITILGKAHKIALQDHDVQYLFQEPGTSLHPGFTVEQSLQEAWSLTNMPDQSIIDALEDVGLNASYLTRYPHELSGGEKQRICLARALLLRPKLLILDEPTSAIDAMRRGQVVDLLKRVHAQYPDMGCLVISHDLKAIRRLCQRVYVMSKGHIVEVNTTQALFDDPKKKETKELLQTV